MSEKYLSVKTRGGVSPQGKQRVFICGLKEDVAQYLDGISDDILKLHDCAVWYENPEEDYDDETLLSLLENMALFVFVVTNRLLRSNNRAVRLLLPFARKNCRAILPVKTEAIDEDRFNELFESANYLDKFSEDPTAIRYEEKLRIFLNTVLLDEKMAQAVRQAFDAYIFLSYRKKDRFFARKLVKKIHERAFCRDVAVWYDEYLTPGRNFEDVIRAMMEKSSLFTVAVTPNILEKGNWVLEHEIPDALDADKEILVAELAKPDDLDGLYRQFEKLPAGTDVDDDEAFTRALRDALRGIDLMKNASDPEHNFYIGLAYLMGIDAEIDRERALELITGAAEAGYFQAIRMLVMMYRTGQGVRTDYREALKWQERETEILRKEYEGGAGDGSEYSVSLLALNEAYTELGERGKAREVLARFKALIDEHPERYMARSWFVYWHKLGNLAKDEHEHEEALHCYGEALSAAERIAETDSSVQALQDLALAHQMPGMIYRRENNIGAALPHTIRALEILEDLDAKYHTEQTARELMGATIHLGEIRQKRGEYEDCEKSYKKSLDIAEKLNSTKETVASARDLYVCYMKLSLLALEREQIQDAVVYAMAAMPYAEGLYKRTQTSAARTDLLNNLKQMQNISEKAGDLASYCFFREKFISLFSEISSPEPSAQLYNKAYLLNELAQKCTQEKEFKNAETIHLKALDVLMEAEKQYSTFELRREAGITCYDLAANALGDGRRQDGIRWLESAIRMQEELFMKSRRAEAAHDIGLSYILKGSLGDMASYDRAISLFGQLYQSTGNQTFLNAMNSAKILRDRMRKSRPD